MYPAIDGNMSLKGCDFMDGNMTAVGAFIRELRENAGYSREELAEKAGINDKFLYEIETGRKGMSAETLYKIATSLSVSTDYLLTGKSKKSDFGVIIPLLESFSDNELKHLEKIIREIAALKDMDNN